MRAVASVHYGWAFLIITVFSILLSVGSIRLFDAADKRFLRIKTRVLGNFITDSYSSVILVLGVLLAFVVSNAWTNTQLQINSIAVEVSTLHNIRGYIELFPSPQRENAIALLELFIDSVVDDEWPLLRGYDSEPVSTNDKFDAFVDYVNVNIISPNDDAKTFAISTAIDAYANLRRMRIREAKTIIPALLWIALIVLILISISIFFLYNIERNVGAGIRTFILMVILIVYLYLLYSLLALQVPYSTTPQIITPNEYITFRKNGYTF